MSSINHDLEFESESIGWFSSESPFLLKIFRIFRHFKIDSSYHIDLLEKQYLKDVQAATNAASSDLLEAFSQTSSDPEPTENGYELFYADFSHQVHDSYKNKTPLEADLLLCLLIELFNLFQFEETEELCKNFVFPPASSHEGTTEEELENNLKDKYDVRQPRGLVQSLFRLLPLFKTSNLFITKLYDLLRLSVYKNYMDLVSKNGRVEHLPDEENSEDIITQTLINEELNLIHLSSPSDETFDGHSHFYLPLSFHPLLLAFFNTCLQLDCPPHIKFPGNRKAHIRFDVSSITTPVNLSIAGPSAPPTGVLSAYILTFWVFIPLNFSRDFDLFDYACKSGTSLKCSILMKNTDGTFPLVLLFPRNTRVEYNVRLKEGQWNFITFRHQSSVMPIRSNTSSSLLSTFSGPGPENREKLFFYVNKEINFEHNLRETFFPQANNLLDFKFGSNLEGLISSINLYSKNYLRTTADAASKEISDENKDFAIFLKITSSFGPYVSDYRSLASVAPSTVETGQAELNSLKYVKLLENWQLLFSLSPASLLNTNLFSKFVCGSHRGDSILMTSIEYEQVGAASKILYVPNEITLVNDESWVLAHLEAGGTFFPLYLFNLYLSALSEEIQKHQGLFPANFCSLYAQELIPSDSLRSSEQLGEASEGQTICDIPLASLNRMKQLRLAALGCLDSISLLLLKHPEHREKFIQIHGCHLLSHYLMTALSSDEARRYFLDKQLIRKVFRLVHSLLDLSSFAEYKGDLIASALQGLVFEFKVWRNLSLCLFDFFLGQCYLLTYKELKSKFFLYIGMDNFLNFLRVYVIKNLSLFTSSSKASNECEEEPIAPVPGDDEEKMITFLSQATKVDLSTLSDVDLVKFVVIHGYDLDLRGLPAPAGRRESVLITIVSIMRQLGDLVTLLVRSSQDKRSTTRNLETLALFVLENKNNFFLDLLFTVLHAQLQNLSPKSDEPAFMHFFLNISPDSKTEISREGYPVARGRRDRPMLIHFLLFKLLNTHSLALGLRFKAYSLWLRQNQLFYNSVFYDLKAFYLQRRRDSDSTEPDRTKDFEVVFVRLFNYWKNLSDYSEILLSSSVWGPSFVLSSLAKIRRLRERGYKRLSDVMNEQDVSVPTPGTVDTSVVSTQMMDSEVLCMLRDCKYSLWIFFSVLSPLLERCSYDGSVRILENLRDNLADSGSTMRQQQDAQDIPTQLDALALNKFFPETILGNAVYFFFFHFYNTCLLSRENFVEFFVSNKHEFSYPSSGRESFLPSASSIVDFKFGPSTDLCLKIFGSFCYHRIKVFFFHSVDKNLEFWSQMAALLRRLIFAQLSSLNHIIEEIIVADESQDSLLDFLPELGDVPTSSQLSEVELEERVYDFKHLLAAYLSKKFLFKIFNILLARLHENEKQVTHNFVDIAAFTQAIYDHALKPAYAAPCDPCFSVDEQQALFNIHHSPEEAQLLARSYTLKKHLSNLASVRNVLYAQVLSLPTLTVSTASTTSTVSSNLLKQWESYRLIFSVLLNFLPYAAIESLDTAHSHMIMLIKTMSKIQLVYNTKAYNHQETFLFLVAKTLFVSKRIILPSTDLDADFCSINFTDADADFFVPRPEAIPQRREKFSALTKDIKNYFSRIMQNSSLNTSPHPYPYRSASISGASSTFPIGSASPSFLENNNIAKHVDRLTAIFKNIADREDIRDIFMYLDARLLEDFERALYPQLETDESDKKSEGIVFSQSPLPGATPVEPSDQSVTLHDASTIHFGDLDDFAQDDVLQASPMPESEKTEPSVYNELPEAETFDAETETETDCLEKVLEEEKKASELAENERSPVRERERDGASPDARRYSNKAAIFKWINHQVGPLNDIIDTERGKLSKFIRYVDLSHDSTQRFWRKLQRRIESEYFFDSHKCQWKLGISHEGPFFGRKRLVLRPRYDFVINKRETKLLESQKYAEQIFHEEHSGVIDESEKLNTSLSFNEISTEELNRVLINAHIVDITQGETAQAETEAESSAGAAASTSSSSPPSTPLDLNEELGEGDGWGLIGPEEDPDDDAEAVKDSLSKENGSQGGSQSNASTTEEKAKAKTYTVVDTVKSEMVTSESFSSHFEEDLRGYYYVSPVETAPRTHGVPSSSSSGNETSHEHHVIMITASGNFPGYLSLAGPEIFFRSSLSAVDENGQAILEDSAAINLHKDSTKIRRRKWRTEYASYIFPRRYRLRDSAIEVFFSRGKHRSFFVDFGHTKQNLESRNSFLRALYDRVGPKCFKQLPDRTPLNKIHEVQKKWMNSKISNFEYLMALNTLAGRSYNDLCQYPVMPWIIADYTSASIDLSKYETFRDLSKPMGALNEKRLEEFLNRYHSFEENVSTGIPAFMYGSHYSTMVGVVLHFLVRLEPFAALHREMQNGHFDVPDRLFSSVPRSFLHNTTQLSEVKEITPEWFTNPDMFRNINHFDFGPTQDGEAVDDVELPPWASCPEEFIRINREALESDYVSEHMNDWIDLIFGYKQRGPASVKACNVFYYLTYSGSIDHYSIEDEMIRRATELQIAHFGQVPVQLFKTPHPKKKSDKFLLVRPLRKLFVLNSVYNQTMLASMASQMSDTSIFSPNFSPALATPFSPQPLGLEDASGKNKKLNLVDPRSEEEIIIHNAPAVLLLRNSPNAVVNIQVFDNKLFCVLDNGTLDLLRFSSSEETKQALLTMQNNTRLRAKLAASSTSSSPSPIASPSQPDDINDLLDGNSAPKSVPKDESPLSQAPQPSLLKPNEPLLVIEREREASLHPSVAFPSLMPFKSFFYFKHQPHYNEFLVTNKDITTTNTDMDTFSYDFISDFSYQELVSGLLRVNQAQRLIYLYGSSTGIVAIREIDQKTGLIRSAGEFLGHKRRVVSLSVETLASGENDVIASLDEGGDLLIWIVRFPLVSPTVTASPAAAAFEITRRPNFQFRVQPAQDMHCHLSWASSLAIVVSGDCVYEFSIERNELLRKFYLTYSPESLASLNYLSSTTSLTDTGSPLVDIVVSPHSEVTPENYLQMYRNGKFSEFSHTGSPLLFIEEQLRRQKWGWSNLNNGMLSVSPASFFYSSSAYDDNRLAARHFTKKMLYSSHGQIILSVRVASFHDGVKVSNLLLSYTLSGALTGYLELESAVTCMLSLDANSSGGLNSDYFVVGCQDGSVRFFSCVDIRTVYAFTPAKYCTQTTVTKRDSPLREGAIRESSRDTSAIVSIALGPSPNYPALLILGTEKGNLYLKPFPDFLKWEKQKNASGLTQLASVPLEAARETLLQVSEAAGSLASNTRIIVDEALNEFSKKVKKSAFVQNFSNFFGGSRRGSATNGSEN